MCILFFYYIFYFYNTAYIFHIFLCSIPIKIMEINKYDHYNFAILQVSNSQRIFVEYVAGMLYVRNGDDVSLVGPPVPWQALSMSMCLSQSPS